jgi:hypothetical protein
MEVYLLNETNDPACMGDLQIFRDIRNMVSHVEAIDVEHGEYSAFRSDGVEIVLSVDQKTGQVITGISDQIQHHDVVVSLLQQYLSFLRRRGFLSVPRYDHGNVDNVEVLLSIIPEQFIQ